MTSLGRTDDDDDRTADPDRRRPYGSPTYGPGEHCHHHTPGSGPRSSPLLTPTGTPYLLLAADPQDTGVRPIGQTQARASAAVRIIDNTSGQPSPGMMMVLTGLTYTLEVDVTNLGTISAYMGLAEFYFSDPAALDAAAADPTGAAPTLLALVPFVSPPGATSTVRCPVSVAPSNTNPVTILVQAYDPIFDRVEKQFTADGDRHVARRDVVVAIP